MSDTITYSCRGARSQDFGAILDGLDALCSAGKPLPPSLPVGGFPLLARVPQGATTDEALSFLFASGRLDVAAWLDARARTACGADLTPIIDSAPDDGTECVAECPKCGTPFRFVRAVAAGE